MYLPFKNGECSIVMLVCKGVNSIFKTTKENGASNLPMQVFGHVPDSEVCNLTIREVTKAPWQRGFQNPRGHSEVKTGGFLVGGRCNPHRPVMLFAITVTMHDYASIHLFIMLFFSISIVSMCYCHVHYHQDSTSSL